MTEEIKYKCRRHGVLLLEGIGKGGIRNGKQRYICRECDKTRQNKRRQAYKEEILKHKGGWKQKNINEAALKRYYKCKNNPSHQETKRAYRVKMIAELKDGYITTLLHRECPFLRRNEIPHELIELKRAVIKLKREIKENMKC